ncbi:MAG: type II secretion system protein [Patescibacteria group bacterium]
MKSSSRGFTLLELLVVISIIAMLSSIVAASLRPARDKSVDTALIEELVQMRNALELYRDTVGSYPVPPAGGVSVINGAGPVVPGASFAIFSGTAIVCGSPVYTPANTLPGLVPTYIPKTPSSNARCYKYASDGKDYHLKAWPPKTICKSTSVPDSTFCDFGPLSVLKDTEFGWPRADVVGIYTENAKDWR